VREIVVRRIEARVFSMCSGDDFDAVVRQVAARALDPYAAAEQILRQ
jgi:hypothetical protein